MLNDSDFLLEGVAPVTLEQPVVTGMTHNEQAVAFIRDEKSSGAFAMLTPDDVKTLVDRHIAVFMQPGFAAHTEFSDMAYANVGVEFVEDFFQLASMVKTLVKYQPFTNAQINMLTDEQILFSTLNPFNFDSSCVRILQGKKVTAFGLNLIKDADGCSRLERLMTNPAPACSKSAAVSSFVLPLLMSLLCSPRLRFALQRDPSLMNSVYCFEGNICNPDICTLHNIPFCDILTLCWELN